LTGIKVWNIRSRATMVEIQAHRVRRSSGPGERYAVRGMQFTPDDRALMTAGEDGNLTLWDLGTGLKTAELAKPRVHSLVLSWTDDNWVSLERVPITAFAASPDGKQIAASFFRFVEIIDVDTRATVRTLGKAPRRGALSLDSLIPNYEKVAKGERISLKAWFYISEDQSGSIERWADLGGADAIWQMRYSPDGKLLAGCGYASTFIWKANSGELLSTLPGPVSLDFAADGRSLALALAYRDEVRVWSLEAERFVNSFQTRASLVAFCRDDKFVLAAQGGRLELTRLSSGQVEWEYPEEKVRGAVRAVAWTPDGTMIAAWDGWNSGLVRLFRPVEPAKD
jgi:WD40 repeat protein